jgi:hypothetical protein
MASASLLACLLVNQFADGVPLYRMAGRLRRLGIELSHTLMSEWLMRKVLDSGHIRRPGGRTRRWGSNDSCSVLNTGSRI